MNKVKFIFLDDENNKTKSKIKDYKGLFSLFS